MKKNCVVALIVLSVLKLVHESYCSSSYSLNQKFEDPKDDPLAKFEDYKDNTLQRKYTILVNKKSEDCYFITDVKLGRMISVDFMVINSDSSGKQLDISFYVRDPNKKYIKFESRKNKGGLLEHQVESEGDYQVCFNNRYSIMQEKRIFWQYEIEGERDIVTEVEKMILETADEYKQQAETTNKAVKTVRHAISRARNNLWWLGSVRKKHHVRMENISKMVSRWSIINVIIVLLVGICQVYALRTLFHTKLPSTRTKTRA